MQAVFEIDNTPARERVVKTSSGEWKFMVQSALFRRSEREASEVEVRCPDEGPYAPGQYSIDGRSFVTDAYGRVAVSPKGFVLAPIRSAAK